MTGEIGEETGHGPYDEDNFCANGEKDKAGWILCKLQFPAQIYCGYGDFGYREQPQSKCPKYKKRFLL